VRVCTRSVKEGIIFRKKLLNNTAKLIRNFFLYIGFFSFFAQWLFTLKLRKLEILVIIPRTLRPPWPKTIFGCFFGWFQEIARPAGVSSDFSIDSTCIVFRMVDSTCGTILNFWVIFLLPFPMPSDFGARQLGHLENPFGGRRYGIQRVFSLRAFLSLTS